MCIKLFILPDTIVLCIHLLQKFLDLILVGTCELVHIQMCAHCTLIVWKAFTISPLWCTGNEGLLRGKLVNPPPADAPHGAKSRVTEMEKIDSPVADYLGSSSQACGLQLVLAGSLTVLQLVPGSSLPVSHHLPARCPNPLFPCFSRPPTDEEWPFYSWFLPELPRPVFFLCRHSEV